MRAFYSKSRISFSLKTKCLKQAYKSSLLVLEDLESHWVSLRIQTNKFGIDRYVSGLCKVPAYQDVKQVQISFSDAVELYLTLKGKNKPITFRNSAVRACYLREVSGDKPIVSYTRKDATSLRDNLFERGLAGSSVVRIFNTI